MTDEQLIEKCIAGNAVAQRQLYDQFAKKMMGVCLRYAGGQDEAQDILQDGFIKIFQNLHRYEGKGSFEGWVRRTIVNTALDSYRKNKISRQHVEIDEASFLTASGEDVISSIAAQDLLGIIQKLPSGYRTVFNLFAIEGYSHKEIADQMEITESTSKSQYRKAKAYLRNLIPSRETV